MDEHRYLQTTSHILEPQKEQPVQQVGPNTLGLSLSISCGHLFIKISCGATILYVPIQFAPTPNCIL